MINNKTQQNVNQLSLTNKITKDIINSLKAKDNISIYKILKQLHNADIAELLNIVGHDERLALVSIIKKELDPEILIDLNSTALSETIDVIGSQQTAEAILELDVEDAVQLVEELTDDEQHDILQSMPDTASGELRESLAYPLDSAGRLMHKEIVAIPEFWQVGQIIDLMRDDNNIPDDFYEFHITDPKLKPIGAVAVSRLIKSKRNILVKDIMQTNIHIINANMEQEEVAFIFRKYGLASAPVTNDEGRIIGTIFMEEILDVINQEAEEDIMRLGGVMETDLQDGVYNTIKQRFPWLFINLITAIIASIVIGLFDEAIEKIVALAVLMPIIASMGGNAGTQTLTIIVRAIVTKQLSFTNAMRLVLKESQVGCLNGLLFSVITGISIYLWYGDIAISLIFAVAMIITLFTAGFFGIVIPLSLVKMKIDPAIASSVFLTTITDVVAFGVFLGLAVWLI
ncbi:MAG: magnesium transporter [Pseudomonadota bacterium]